jgi:hypothetical protein
LRAVSGTQIQFGKIQLIQNQALRLACTTWKSTSVAAVQVECGEMPLQCRRLAQQRRFTVKVKAAEGHVAQSVFEEHWSTAYGKYDDRNCPMAAKVDKYFEQRGASDRMGTCATVDG